MKQNGFTLVELMIVIAIIGIVTAIAVPAFCQAFGYKNPFDTPVPGRIVNRGCGPTN